jgi:hypothetical protein
MKIVSVNIIVRTRIDHRRPRILKVSGFESFLDVEISYVVVVQETT